MLNTSRLSKRQVAETGKSAKGLSMSLIPLFFKIIARKKKNSKEGNKGCNKLQKKEATGHTTLQRKVDPTGQPIGSKG